MTNEFTTLVEQLNERHGFDEDSMTAVCTVPYDVIAEAVLQYLVDKGDLEPNDHVYDIDLALPINDDGLVEFDIEFRPGGVQGNN